LSCSGIEKAPQAMLKTLSRFSTFAQSFLLDELRVAGQMVSVQDSHLAKMTL
jgi:hypothetical protein